MRQQVMVLVHVVQKRKPVSPEEYVGRALEAFGKKAKVSSHRTSALAENRGSRGCHAPCCSAHCFE